MKVKDLIAILSQFNENLPVGVAVQGDTDTNEDWEEFVRDNLAYNDVWYNPIAGRLYIGGMRTN